MAFQIALVMVTPAFAIGLLAIIIWILVTSILLWMRASDSPQRSRRQSHCRPEGEREREGEWGGFGREGGVACRGER